MTIEVLALIPARGGSKSVPRKNVLPLVGKPLIAYSIVDALAAELVTRVIVTTDDDEIAQVALDWGAEVPFRRPAEISNDAATDIEYQSHALRWLAENEAYRPALMVILRPPHPLRRPATIDRAIRLMLEHPEADSLRSVKLAEQTPYKMWRLGGDGFLETVADLEGEAEPYNMPRQALPAVFWQDGYIDIARPEVVLTKNSTTGRKILPLVIEEDAIDIDYPDQLRRAEELLSRAHGDATAERDADGPAATIRYPS